MKLLRAHRSLVTAWLWGLDPHDRQFLHASSRKTRGCCGSFLVGEGEPWRLGRVSWKGHMATLRAVFTLGASNRCRRKCSFEYTPGHLGPWLLQRSNIVLPLPRSGRLKITTRTLETPYTWSACCWGRLFGWKLWAAVGTSTC